jgi:hypothetical protein
LFKNAQHKEVIEKINAVNIESLDILEQEYLGLEYTLVFFLFQRLSTANGVFSCKLTFMYCISHIEHSIWVFFS